MDGGFGPIERDRGRWYAVKAIARKEQIAACNLTRQGFEAYLPLIFRSQQFQTKAQVRPAAFFPGYLFVKLDLDGQPWRSVNGTIGVSRLVQFGERPTAVPRGLIEGLKLLTSDTGELQFGDDLVVGASVRVMAGPFENFIGVLARAEAHERVTILIDAMERQIRVTVPRGLLMAAD